MPVWKENGEEFVHCTAIIRKLGIRHGYYSCEPDVIQCIDKCVEDCSAVDSYLDPTINMPKAFGKPEACSDEEALKLYCEKTEPLAARLAACCKPGCYIAGTSKPTIADFWVLHVLSVQFDNDAHPYPCCTEAGRKTLASHPGLKAYYEKMCAENQKYLSARGPSPL